MLSSRTVVYEVQGDQVLFFQDEECRPVGALSGFVKNILKLVLSVTEFRHFSKRHKKLYLETVSKQDMC